MHIYTAGPDGIDFDADGNLYTGSFGDGRFWRIRNLGGGKYAQPELLDDHTIACCDGIVYDAKRNRIILTAAAQNALYAWNIAEGKLELMWANGDTDGADRAKGGHRRKGGRERDESRRKAASVVFHGG